MRGLATAGDRSMTPVAVSRRFFSSIMNRAVPAGPRPCDSPGGGESDMTPSHALRSLSTGALLLCVLLSACTRDPNVRKQKYFDSGNRYFSEGRYAEARIQYSNAIRIDSRFASAHYQLARTYLKLGDKNRGFQELSRSVELDPPNYAAHTDLADLLVTVRNPDGSPNLEAMKDARSHLDILRANQPNTPETHAAWSHYYEAQNKLGPAMQEMQQAIALDPNRSESYLVLGLLQRSTMPDAAEANLKKAIEVDPKATGAIMILADFYESHNRLSEAEQQFRHAMEVDPKDTAPRAALVTLFMHEGRTPEIEAFLEQTKKDLPDNSAGYRMLGDFYFASGDLDKATAEYSSLSRDHSGDPLVKKNYIQLLILKNRLDEAAKLNHEVLKAAPADVDAFVYKGQIELHRKNTNAAIEALETALHSDPDNAVAHYHLGLAFDQQHDITRAESEWRQAVRIRPDLSEAQRALAALELTRGDFSGLLEISRQIINAQPNSADGFLLKCVAETGLHRYRDAQRDAMESIERAPESPAPYVQMGNLHVAQKHYAEAERSYRQALDQDPSYSDGLGGLMNTYVAQKRYDKAIAAANVQIAKSPNNSNFYDLLGTARLNGQKDLPGAEVALRKAVDLDKNNTDAVEKLGKVQIEEGSTDKALALYEQSLKENPHDVRFCILIGDLYAARQNWDRAKAMYQQALSLEPDEPHASNNLAHVILEQGGKVDVALAMAQTARRGMAESSSAADTLGWAYYQKGVYQSAISQFEEALRLDEKQGVPDNATIHYHLGLAYQKANQNALARQHLEKALKLRPNNADAKKALSELRS